MAACLRRGGWPLIALYFGCLCGSAIRRWRGSWPVSCRRSFQLGLRRRLWRRFVSVGTHANDLTIHIFVAIRVNPFALQDRPSRRQWRGRRDFHQRLAPRSFTPLRGDFSFRRARLRVRRRALGCCRGCETRRPLQGDNEGRAGNERDNISHHNPISIFPWLREEQFGGQLAATNNYRTRFHDEIVPPIECLVAKEDCHQRRDDVSLEARRNATGLKLFCGKQPKRNRGGAAISKHKAAIFKSPTKKNGGFKPPFLGAARAGVIYPGARNNRNPAIRSGRESDRGCAHGADPRDGDDPASDCDEPHGRNARESNDADSATNVRAPRSFRNHYTNSDHRGSTADRRLRL